MALTLLQITEGQPVVQQATEVAQQVTTTAPVVSGTETIPVIDLALKGGWIMIPIVLLFLISIYIFIERFLLIRKAAQEQSNFMSTIRDAILHDRIDSAKSLCAHTDSPIARMIDKGISRMGKPLNDIRSAIENVGSLEVSRLEKNLTWLSIAAGAGPMIGFLGTVVGMVRVFFDMAAKGNNIDVATLSSGMYQAMVTTVAGLIVGITAFICYNILVSKIEKLVFVLEARTTEFMDLLHEPVK